MSSQHEVISAFLDDEPFDSEELAIALSDPDGRAMLIDLVALRRIVQPDEALQARTATTLTMRRMWRVTAAAAALLLAVAGGYAAGDWRSSQTPEAPTPTRVVQAAPYSPSGGIR